MKPTKKFLISLFGFLCGILFAGAALAQTADNINYPVPELGNCQNKSECKAYCDDPSHINVCTDFAVEHDMISPEKAQYAQKMRNALKRGGPGGCTSEKECMTYCDDFNHFKECMSFAEKHKFLPQGAIKEMKRVSKAIEKGADSPGNCKNGPECRAYCQNPSHMEECLKFAEKSGMMPKEKLEKAKKAAPLMAQGRSPGGCKSKAECDAYCKQKGHFEECISFAEKAGLMSKEKAQRARRMGMKGPGGCSSKAECEAYCNNPENQEKCFEFGKKHGLIPEEKLEKMKQGVAQMRSGIADASPDALKCVREKLGSDTLQKIKDGTYMPGPNAGSALGECMERNRRQIKGKISETLESAPPEVVQCFKNNLGEEGYASLKDGEIAADPQKAATIRNCFEKAKQFMKQKMLKQQEQNMGQMMRSLQGAPQEVVDCLNKIESNFVQKVRTGEYKPDAQSGEKIKQCFEKHMGQSSQQRRPDDISGIEGEPGQPGGPSADTVISEILKQVPSEARNCVKNGITQDMIEKMKQGNVSASEIQNLLQECIKSIAPSMDRMPSDSQIPKGEIPESQMPSGDMPQGMMPSEFPEGQMPDGEYSGQFGGNTESRPTETEMDVGQKRGGEDMPEYTPTDEMPLEDIPAEETPTEDIPMEQMEKQQMEKRKREGAIPPDQPVFE